MDTKGGRFTIDINGTSFSGRAEAKISPARATPENGVNWDGSGYNIVAPQLARIELSFDRGQGFTWTEDMILQPVNLTFAETDARVTHYLTAGNWSGRPEINSKDGEVTGMALESDKYRAART